MNETRQITVRVSPEIKKQFKAAAKREGISLNAWMIVAAQHERKRQQEEAHEQPTK